MTDAFDPKIAAVLDRLHRAAGEDGARWRDRRAAGADESGLVRMGEMYLALSRDEGQFLHLLARAMQARRVVEFGASFGISTLYLAAAMQATGGHLTTTEVHPAKCAALRKTLAEAGVGDRVTLLEGDALETLRDVEGPIDLLLLDGWKSMYLPVFDLLRPRLRPDALVVADNCDHAGAQDFVAAVSGPASGPVSAGGLGCITHRMGDSLLVVVPG